MKRKILVSCLCFILLFNSFSIPVSANEDYLSITLADIVITYFNATGVAIGETELFNAIQTLWGNVTLNDLVDNNVLVGSDADWTKDDIKSMIGFGNLSMPFIRVNQRNLKSYLGDVPISNVAHDALDAMFNFDSPVTDGIFSALAVILGDVANIGRQGYDLVSTVVEDLTGVFPISTLKEAYQKFTDSTYFQDLLEEGIPSGGGGGGDSPAGSPTVNFSPEEGYELAGFYNPSYNLCFLFGIKNNYIPVAFASSSNPDLNVHACIYNYTGSSQIFYYYVCTYEASTNSIILRSTAGLPFNNDELKIYDHLKTTNPLDVHTYGKAVVVPYECSYSEAKQYAIQHNPWGNSGNVNHVTKYINNAVGNIASDNYLNLSPNIGTKEYINIFDRIAYIENLNQIENNTDNGDYSQNSTVINNYNNQYIENTIPTARPSTAPAQNPDEQPAQPFVSPRPTQPPEFVESVVQEGGLSSEITTKFPFCIPWDIKALIDNLWAPEARAPYIHWDAEFGSWGKLGEVDIDLSEYDDVAKIFRSTTLLFWIVGLIVLTRNLIG